ncbi:hypothetical protein D3Z47_17115 [Lachnospiraceae bacterium]|nr:hypothetical protein [Lachnospiraceae bacterium]
MNHEQSLSPIIEKLESLFSSFNDYFYNGRLQKPVITINSNGRRVNWMGWCTSWKAWSDDTGRPETVANGNSSGYYEINISAEYLDRPFEETCGTLLHEMAHLYNAQCDIQDTCRSGLYHNKQFKRAAEEHGLVVSKDVTYGFNTTRLNDEATIFVTSLKDMDFHLHRKKMRKASMTGQKSSTRKYICPRCGLIIRATREAHVLCMACGVELEQRAK